MAERAALQRQIEELQQLIKEHKRVHGDAPSRSGDWLSARRGVTRGRGHTPSYSRSFSHQTAPYSSDPWRKPYSLINKTIRACTGTPVEPFKTPLNPTPPGKNVLSSSVLDEGSNKTSTVTSSNVPTKKATPERSREPPAGGNRTVLKPTRATETGNKGGAEIKSRLRGASSLDPSGSVRSRSDKSGTSNPKTSAASSLVKASRTILVPTQNSTHTVPAVAPSVAHAAPGPSTSPNRSRFTWVKDQAPENSPSGSKTCQSSLSAVTGPTTPSGTKQAHGSNRKAHRKLNISPSSLKASRFSWVSTSAASARPAQRGYPPKSIRTPGKKERLGGTKKSTGTPHSVKKARVGTLSQLGHTSRYRWKASPASPVTVGRDTPKSRKGSVYRWTSPKQNPGLVPAGVEQRPVHLLSGGGFRLRSRTKIIHSSNRVPERRSSVSVSRYSLRVRSPSGARRGQARVLVALSRHKLRRLSSSTSTSSSSSWSTRTGSSVRSPASQGVIKTRYKIDTRRENLHLNPTHSYRLKKVQSARVLLQSRLRSTPDRQWRGRGMRWIGGALYRVSANKLSRTPTTSTPTPRAGRFLSPHDVSAGNLWRTSSTRHVASRAVQRSLAIIRQAQQRKQQAKQYCMYYNRFGKCNRATACPFIHDPEKVAVCTRFLRGTCKQTDGNCPFSHKVSKEKMPVCSYFLKGICNNSSCPYSHVYVSRKAAVCQDFVRGYCPQGEKCKRKHTLLCPDFSSTGACPHGSKCKLQHRYRPKRSGSGPNLGSLRKAHGKESKQSTEPESKPAEDDTPTKGPAKLPSFISLSSSSESPEGPPCPPAAKTETEGKRLHIKPRFSRK